MTPLSASLILVFPLSETHLMHVLLLHVCFAVSSELLKLISRSATALYQLTVSLCATTLINDGKTE